MEMARRPNTFPNMKWIFLAGTPDVIELMPELSNQEHLKTMPIIYNDPECRVAAEADLIKMKERRGGSSFPSNEPEGSITGATVLSGACSAIAPAGPELPINSAIAIPSYHLIGSADGIVPPSSSRSLTSKFVNPVISEHDGGHHIPTAARALNEYCTWLSQAVHK